MAQHAQLASTPASQVYFCDPHSPWQRGTNENTNGLLRQYFPKGTDLSRHSPDDLAAVALALNTRPRKTLGWRTPAEALNDFPAAARSQNDRWSPDIAARAAIAVLQEAHASTVLGSVKGAARR